LTDIFNEMGINHNLMTFCKLGEGRIFELIRKSTLMQ